MPTICYVIIIATLQPVSYTHLDVYKRQLFKRMTGKNYITYVTDSRIEMAKRMLVDTEMPVINIAYELSYNETNYFSKAFKKKEMCIRDSRWTKSELLEQIQAGAWLQSTLRCV